MDIHPRITFTKVLVAAHRQQTMLEDPGFCIACGFAAGGCEPDATEIECESCGEPAVHGASQLLIMMS